MNFLRPLFYVLSICTLILSNAAFSSSASSNPLEQIWTQTNQQSVSHLHNSDLATIYGGEDIAKHIHLNTKALA